MCDNRIGHHHQHLLIFMHKRVCTATVLSHSSLSLSCLLSLLFCTLSLLSRRCWQPIMMGLATIISLSSLLCMSGFHKVLSHPSLSPSSSSLCPSGHARPSLFCPFPLEVLVVNDDGIDRHNHNLLTLCNSTSLDRTTLPQHCHLLPLLLSPPTATLYLYYAMLIGGLML